MASRRKNFLFPLPLAIGYLPPVTCCLQLVSYKVTLVNFSRIKSARWISRSEEFNVFPVNFWRWAGWIKRKRTFRSWRVRPESTSPIIIPRWRSDKSCVASEEAIQSGADYLVIGRPITQAKDPVKALNKIIHSFLLFIYKPYLPFTILFISYIYHTKLFISLI